MALASGLYKSQDQQEQDLTDGPGWTIDSQKPAFFDNLAGAVPRGIGQGVADGISLLTHGLHGLTQNLPLPNPLHLMTSPVQAALEIAGTKPVPSALQDASEATRAFSKTLVADPRTTGVAANLVQGFSKAATEFTAGSLAGGPGVGATLMGATEGYAHYGDLLDQGVDEATATKSGLLTAMTSGAGALLPMGMPAKWLAGLATPTALAAQVGTGAAINTAFGAASRYGSAKILDDAGYHEMAAQQKPWDETNLLTDALTGMFFGAHAGWHGLKGLDAANVDPSVRDAAKVVQDRQEVLERAPGVPVDMKSAAVHRHALETALGDLMTDKPVDLSGVDTEGATFARRPVEEGTPEAAQIMREAFEKSGVLDDAAQFDRWLTGDQEIEATTPKPKAAPVELAAEPAPMKFDRSKYDEVGPGSSAKANGVTPRPEPQPIQPHEMTSDEIRGEADKSDAKDVETLKEAFGNEEDATKFRKLAASNADSAYERSERMLEKLTPEQRAVVYKWEQRGPDTPRFDSSELRGVAKGMDHIAAAETPEELGGLLAHDLTDVGEKTNPADMNTKELTAYMRLKRAMELAQEKGWNTADISREAIQASARRFSDPLDAEYMLSRFLKTEGPAAPAIHDHPGLTVVDEAGEPHAAALTYDGALAAEAQANKEAEPMFQAAVGCEARHQ